MKLIFFLYIMDNHDLYEAHILPFMLLHIKHRRCNNNNNNNNILFYFIFYYESGSQHLHRCWLESILIYNMQVPRTSRGKELIDKQLEDVTIKLMSWNDDGICWRTNHIHIESTPHEAHFAKIMIHEYSYKRLMGLIQIVLLNGQLYLIHVWFYVNLRTIIKRHVLKRDWTTCSQFVNIHKFGNEHNWKKVWDEPKLLGDSGEVPISEWSGWRFNTHCEICSIYTW